MTDDLPKLDLSTVSSLQDPRARIESTPLTVVPVTREFGPDEFDAVRDHHDSLAGVVQVGLRNDDGQLLLQGWDGPSQWAPPGGWVAPGRDWIGEASESMEELLDVAVSIDALVRLEEITFRCPETGESVSTVSAFLLASFAEAAPAVVENPQIAPGSQFADEEMALDWFEAVPPDANENHVDHIEHFLHYCESSSAP